MERIIIIIICAGEATRWGNHLGVPKHFAPIDGEPILNRTVRQLLERGMRDIHVVSKDDPRYKIEGAEQYIARVDYENNADADKFLSSKELWNKDGRTIVMYGDCFFTDDAIDQILKFDNRRWTLFCRPFASKITRTPWGECFAQSFYPEDIEKHESALHLTARLFKEGAISRCGGWEHFNAFIGKETKDITNVEADSLMASDHCYVINDWTDDFDYPEDYDRFVVLRAKK